MLMGRYFLTQDRATNQVKTEITNLNSRRYPSESPLIRRSCAEERLEVEINDVIG